MRIDTLWLLACLPAALAFDITGKLVPSAILNADTIPLDSKLVLDHNAHRTSFREDGTFEFRNVKPGRHIVEPLVPGYAFNSFIVTIAEDETVHVQNYYPTRLPQPISSPSLAYPLELTALVKEDYYMPPPGMNVLGLLKSPMVLMMGFSAIMMFFMPKLMANMEMDPDMAKDMAETRKKMTNMDWSGSLSSMLAGEGNEGSLRVEGNGSARGGESEPVAAVASGAGQAPVRAGTPIRGGTGKRGAKRR